VYLNGSHLSPADFTATNGSDVVLGVAASADDVCDIISYTPFEVADATFTGTTTLDGAVVINESSADVDFRVESNGNANMLFVDGGFDGVGIGVAPKDEQDGFTTLRIAGPLSLSVDSAGVGAGVYMGNNVYRDETNDRWEYVLGDEASQLVQANGAFTFRSAVAGSANGAITWVNKFQIALDGAVTMPLQPAFSVDKNGTDQNNLAVNASVTVTWGAERFDNNADFGAAGFTAPVTGKYQLSLSLRLGNLDSASEYYIISIVTSNTLYRFVFDPDFGQDAVYWNVAFSVLADMDTSDTAYVSFNQASGAAQTDIIGDPDYTFFTGFLAC